MTKDPLLITMLVLLPLSAAPPPRGCSVGGSSPTNPRPWRPYPGPRDSVPPAMIDDLRVESVTPEGIVLAWTEVGDDGMIGPVGGYKILWEKEGRTIRPGYSPVVNSAPSPNSPGAVIRASIYGPVGERISLAVRAYDDGGNVTPLSASVSAEIPGRIGRRQTLATGWHPRLFLGDLDGDGDEDLVSQLGESGVAIHLREGAVLHSTTLSVSDQPIAGVGDFTGNGAADLLVWHEDLLWNSNLVWHENLGNGVFAEPGHSMSALPGLRQFAEVADVDGDGWDDILLAGESRRFGDPIAGGLVVRRSGPEGFRDSRVLLPTCIGMAVADPGPGREGRILAVDYSNLYVFGSIGSGGIQGVMSAPLPSVLVPNVWLAPAQIDADGLPDLLINGSGLRIHTGPGFSFMQSLPTTGRTVAIDVNEDGRNDLVGANSRLVIWMQGEDGRFRSLVWYDIPAVDIVLLDLDDDGRQELVVATRGTSPGIEALWLQDPGTHPDR